VYLLQACCCSHPLQQGGPVPQSINYVEKLSLEDDDEDEDLELVEYDEVDKDDTGIRRRRSSAPVVSSDGTYGSAEGFQDSVVPPPPTFEFGTGRRGSTNSGSGRGTPAALPRLQLTKSPPAPVPNGGGAASSTDEARESLLNKSPAKLLKPPMEAPIITVTPANDMSSSVSPSCDSPERESKAERFSGQFRDRRISMRSTESDIRSRHESVISVKLEAVVEADGLSDCGSDRGRLEKNDTIDTQASTSVGQQMSSSSSPAQLSRGTSSDVVDDDGEKPGTKTRRGSVDSSEKQQAPASDDFFSRLDQPVLYMQENPINFKRLTVRNDSSSSSSSSGSSGDGEDNSSSGEEEWSTTKKGQVEVPIWLMDRLKERKQDEDGQPGQEVGDGEDEAEEEDQDREGLEEIHEEEEDDEFDVSPIPVVKQGTDRERKEKRPPPKSALRNSNDGAPGQDKSKDRKISITVPSNSFWKIPMPTRKNTIHVPKKKKKNGQELDSDEEDDSDDDDGSKAGGLNSQIVKDRLTPGAPSLSVPGGSRQTLPMGKMRKGSGTTMPTSNKKVNLTVQDTTGKGNSRRPSALGMFSDGKASQDGLYALPKEPSKGKKDREGNSEEVVEVRRDSLVMSTSMMEMILKSKSKSMSSRLLKTMEMSKDEMDEIVLPLFTAKKSSTTRGQCSCKVDRLTGQVIHTCMSPSITNATNTETMQSFICSEWHSKAATTRGSRRESKEAETTRKRVRNMSMLAGMSGTRGPAPAKQTGDEDEEAEEGTAAENELAVSFCSIQKNSRLQSQRGSVVSIGAGGNAAAEAAGTDGEASSSGEGSNKTGQHKGLALDEQVEAELGHRFDIIEPSNLSVMLLDPESREHLLIVDVRGRDWVGGHIPSSINLRTSEVLKHPESLLAQCRQNRIQIVVFTCMYSVLRARKCAAALEEAQGEEQRAGHATYRIKTYLLCGGMHAWVNHFVGAPSGANPPKEPSPLFLIDFAPEMWSDGGPSQGGLVHVMDALWSSGGQKALSDALTEELMGLAAARAGEEQNKGESRRASATSENGDAELDVLGLVSAQLSSRSAQLSSRRSSEGVESMVKDAQDLLK